MKKWHYWVIGILLLLIVTNPSAKSFKEYLGRDSYFGLIRKYNFFVFSIYETKGSVQYLGLVGNFFEIKVLHN